MHTARLLFKHLHAVGVSPGSALYEEPARFCTVRALALLAFAARRIIAAEVAIF